MRISGTEPSLDDIILYMGVIFLYPKRWIQTPHVFILRFGIIILWLGVIFLRWIMTGVIFLRRIMTPRSLFYGGHYSSLHRCRIEFWPHSISTRGVLIQRAVLRIQRIFHVNLRPPRQGSLCYDPSDGYNFEFIPRWIITTGPNSTLNYGPESWFNV